MQIGLKVWSVLKQCSLSFMDTSESLFKSLQSYEVAIFVGQKWSNLDPSIPLQNMVFPKSKLNIIVIL